MNLRIELKGGAMTASMRGELDHHTAGEMREQIDSTAKKVRPQKLILDFKEVPFMDSSGIGLILGRVRTAALWGGHVTVRGLSPQLKKMAELSGVSALAVLEDTGKGAKTRNRSSTAWSCAFRPAPSTKALRAARSPRSSCALTPSSQT